MRWHCFRRVLRKERSLAVKVADSANGYEIVSLCSGVVSEGALLHIRGQLLKH